MQTKLFETVCKRAAITRAPYAQSSWPTNTSTIKRKSSSQSKTGISIPNKSIPSNDTNIKLVNKKNIINDIYMQLIQLLDINENGRLVLPFSRRLILIDCPRDNLHPKDSHMGNNLHNDYQSPQYEVSTSTSQSYLSNDDENNSEHNTTFVSMSLPPSPFICDPYESYDWEC
ncbi:unnamed protein product [Rotaria sp. Silwood2]|nr:unnamed protein product [Rotaria sp. Silwood2]CAF4176380.1 unnamed protein product [Rotaria sp. Silwood2]